jgi:RND family efflux transporter MFP subunit
MAGRAHTLCFINTLCFIKRNTMISKLSKIVWLSLCVAVLGGCGSEEMISEEVVRPVRTARVGDLEQLQGRLFPGRAMATQEVELSFRVAGPLISLPIRIGDRVQQGDLLARIDPRDFEVTLRNTKAQLQRAKASLDRADSEYVRLKGVEAKDPDLVAEVHLERAREAFELGKADTAALEATVDAAQDALDYTYLKAPYDGTIVANYVENFEYVQARQGVVRLLNNNRVDFLFSVPETFISLIHQVDNIRVRFDAFPNLEIPAEIKEVGTEASQSTRTYPITLIMDQPEGVEILPGMAGRASGEARTLDQGEKLEMVVPNIAIFSPGSGEKNYVWVIDPETERTSRREVALGGLVSTGVTIQSGLEPGELIATAGVNFLEEGQKVRPITE